MKRSGRCDSSRSIILCYDDDTLHVDEEKGMVRRLYATLRYHDERSREGVSPLLEIWENSDSVVKVALLNFRSLCDTQIGSFASSASRSNTSGQFQRRNIFGKMRKIGKIRTR